MRRLILSILVIFTLSCSNTTKETGAITHSESPKIDFESENIRSNFLAVANLCNELGSKKIDCTLPEYQRQGQCCEQCCLLKLKHHETVQEAYIEAFINPDLFFVDGKLILDDPFALQDLRTRNADVADEITEMINQASKTHLVYTNTTAFSGKYDLNSKSFKGFVFGLSALNFRTQNELKSSHARIYWSLNLAETIALTELPVAPEKAKDFIERQANTRQNMRYDLIYDVDMNDGEFIVTWSKLTFYMPDSDEIFAVVESSLN